MIDSIEIDSELDNKTDHRKIIALLERVQNRHGNARGNDREIIIHDKGGREAITVRMQGGNFANSLLEKLKAAGLYITHPYDFRDTTFHLAVRPAGQVLQTGYGGIAEPGESIFPPDIFPEPLPKGSLLHVVRTHPGTTKNLRLATWIAENIGLPFAVDPIHHQNNQAALELDIVNGLSDAHPDLALSEIRVNSDYESREMRVRLGYQSGSMDSDFVSAGATAQEAI